MLVELVLASRSGSFQEAGSRDIELEELRRQSWKWRPFNFFQKLEIHVAVTHGRHCHSNDHHDCTCESKNNMKCTMPPVCYTQTTTNSTTPVAGRQPSLLCLLLIGTNLWRRSLNVNNPYTIPSTSTSSFSYMTGLYPILSLIFVAFGLQLSLASAESDIASVKNDLLAGLHCRTAGSYSCC